MIHDKEITHEQLETREWADWNKAEISPFHQSTFEFSWSTVALFNITLSLTIVFILLLNWWSLVKWAMKIKGNYSQDWMQWEIQKQSAEISRPWKSWLPDTLQSEGEFVIKWFLSFYKYLTLQRILKPTYHIPNLPSTLLLYVPLFKDGRMDTQCGVSAYCNRQRFTVDSGDHRYINTTYRKKLGKMFLFSDYWMFKDFRYLYYFAFCFVG